MPFDGTNYKHNTVAAFIREGIRRIQTPNRWTKGPIFGGDGPHCILTSLPIGAPHAVAVAAVVALHRQAGKRNFGGAHRFNDDPDTTHEMVLQLMEDAALEVEAAG